MADIFISYKREDQEHARQLADALEGQGWTVWWDPKLRAGERFDDVIDAALKAANCVIVIWSERSVESNYVKDEATYALNHKKLMPLAIEDVDLPFRFEGIHTPQLYDWDGSTSDVIFKSLISDIAGILGPPPLSVVEEQCDAAGRTKQRREKEEVETSTNPSGTIFSDKLKDGSEGPEMVVIPAGTFQMGTSKENERRASPQHKVTILKPFAIGKYPVTNAEYRAYRHKHRSGFLLN